MRKLRRAHVFSKRSPGGRSCTCPVAMSTTSLGGLVELPGGRFTGLGHESVKTEAHLRTADYLGPHHGAGGFRTATQVPT